MTDDPTTTEPGEPDPANVDPTHPTAPDEPIEGTDDLPADVPDGDAGAGDDEPDA